jgi:mannosyltransferase
VIAAAASPPSPDPGATADPGTVASWTRGDTLAVAAVAGGALVLRAVNLATASLWIDEVYSLRDAEVLSANASLRPLYYLFLRAWQGVAGSDVAWLRAPSAVFGAAAVALLYVLVRRVGGRAAATLSAGTLALAASELARSQEIRMYALATLLALASVWALWRWHDRPSTVTLTAAVALLAAATAATPTTLLVTVPAVLGALAGARRSPRRQAALLGALFVLAAAAAPYAWRHRGSVAAMQGAAARASAPGAGELLGWPARQLAAFPGYTLRLPGFRTLATLLGITLLVLGALAVTAAPRVSRTAARVLAACLALAVAGSFVYSRVAPPFWEVRYFHALTPLLAALCGLGAAAAVRRHRLAGVAAAALLLALTAAGALAFHSPVRNRGQWRALAEWALALSRPYDAVILQGDEQLRAWHYYGGSAIRTYTLSSLGIDAGDRGRVSVATMLAAAPPGCRRLFFVLEPAMLEGPAPRRAARRQLAAAGRVLGSLPTGSLEILLLDRAAPTATHGAAGKPARGAAVR